MKGRDGKIRHILLLDTEGIQAMEARDPKFDSRIIFFIMCVSNIVMVCNKGEMNEQMVNTLTLVIDNWINTRAEVTKDSRIFVVMNKLTEIPKNMLRDSRRQILEHLRIDEKVGKNNKLESP
mmetsp:Transcript_12490/g.19513  ORF Transcript_12490/g.19513 Transcript_12490/m.19513 type:complete len:122 (+) Transcript_12490:562-927(+)